MVALLALGLALALALRLLESLGTPLWFDEIYTLSVARLPFRDLVSTVARDIHPPLPFLLRGVWLRVGGEGELWVRSLSILAALLSLVWTWRLGRRLFGAGAALITVLLLAVNVSHVRYSQEVEDYPLTWLTLLGCIDAAWRWIEHRRGVHAVLYVVWALLALYTHYIALFILATLFLWGTITLRGDTRALRRWVGLHVAVAVLFIPQGRVFLEQFRREGSGRFFHFPAAAAVVDLWRRLSFNATYLILPLLALSALPLLRREQRRAASLLWLLCTLPLLSPRLWVVILPREVLYIAPLWLLLVGAGLMGLPGRRTGPALAALLFAFGARAYLRHQPFPEAVALERAESYVLAHAVPGDLVVHAESHSFLFFNYHAPRARNVLLVEAGQRVPYFEGGLAIPESLYVSPERWEWERASGEHWWGVRVDRAYVTRGVATRAGAAGAARMQAACDSAWSFPPVTLYRGH